MVDVNASSIVYSNFLSFRNGLITRSIHYNPTVLLGHRLLQLVFSVCVNCSLELDRPFRERPLYEDTLGPINYHSLTSTRASSLGLIKRKIESIML